MKISTSILSIKDNLKENVDKLCKCDTDYIHLDIMDGKFVENKTWDICELETLNFDKPLDIHLMVNDVYSYIELYKRFNPEFITFHYEIDCDIMQLIDQLKNNNIKVGLSIKPETQVDAIIKYLPFVDLVLVMSVEPGKGGQKFITESSLKVNKLNELREQYNYRYVIEVDGGINNETINLISNADIAVIGSYITNGNYEEQIKKVKENIYG